LTQFLLAEALSQESPPEGSAEYAEEIDADALVRHLALRNTRQKDQIAGLLAHLTSLRNYHPG